MIQSITLDDADGNAVTLHSETGTRQIRHAGGFTGIGSPRESRRVRPSSHGAVDETRYEDGRLMVVEGAVWSQTSQTAAWTEWDAITTPMVQTLDVGPALIKWTRTGGLALQRLVKVAGEVDPPIEDGAAMLQYQAQFFAEDPRAFSQTLTTSTGAVLSTGAGGMTMPFTFPFTFSTSGGGAASVTNAGNRPTPGVFRIYGSCTNPRIALSGTSGVITLVGTVAAGDYLEVGTDAHGARYVRLNGVTSRMNFLSGSATTWFDLPAGSSTVQMFASDFDASARCDVVLRSAYA